MTVTPEHAITELRSALTEMVASAPSYSVDVGPDEVESRHFPATLRAIAALQATAHLDPGEPESVKAADAAVHGARARLESRYQASRRRPRHVPVPDDGQGWMDPLCDDDLIEMQKELPALIDAYRASGDPGPVDEAVRAWVTTAETVATFGYDRLLSDVGDGDFVEAEHP